MSFSQKIDALVPHVDPEGLLLLKEIGRELTHYLPDQKYNLVMEALDLGEDLNPESLEYVIDELEMAVARYFRPSITQMNAYRRDMKTFFSNVRYLFERDRIDGIRQYMGYFPKIFTPGGKLACGARVRVCNECEYKFNDPEPAICPECDRPRRLCSIRPNTNGRCIYHGGNTLGGQLVNKLKSAGRARMYAHSLNGRLQEMFIEAMTDPEYLSLAPEISALATRAADLLGKLDDTDYMVIATGINRARRNIEKYIKEEKPEKVMYEAQEILRLIDKDSDSSRRWEEFSQVAMRLSKIAESERRRAVEAQHTITAQQMFAIRQETLVYIRDAATFASARVYRMIQEGEADKIKPIKIRNEFLFSLKQYMDGDRKPKVDDDALMIEGEIEIVDSEEE